MIRNIEVVDQVIIYTRYEIPPDGLVQALAPFKAQYREIQVGGASGREPELVLLVNFTLSMFNSVTYDLLKLAFVRAWDWARRQPYSDRAANKPGEPSALLKLYIELDNDRRARFDISASDSALVELALDRLPTIIESVQNDGVGLWLEGGWEYYEWQIIHMRDPVRNVYTTSTIGSPSSELTEQLIVDGNGAERAIELAIPDDCGHLRTDGFGLQERFWG